MTRWSSSPSWADGSPVSVKRALIPAVILGCLSAGYLSLSTPVRERLASLFSVEHEIQVEVASVHQRTLRRTLTARGEILPVKETRINSNISGTVKEIPFAAGERITKGAVIATIEAGDLAERLAVQEVAVKEAAEEIKKSERESLAAEKHLSAMRDLFQKNFIARREVEIAEAAAATARAQKEAAEAQLAQRLSSSAQTRHVLSLTRITVPVAGLVSRRWVEAGARVTESTPLVSISQTETLKFFAEVKSADTKNIVAGTPGEIVVDGLPEKVFRGKVTRIQELANFSGDESSLEVELANPGNALTIGMAATVSLPLEDPRDGIFVPLSARVQTEAGPSHVFVLEEGKARRKEAVFGKPQGSEIEVLSGLQPGELVVAKGVERLRDGSRVLAVE